MKEFLINKNDSGQRADKFIQKALPNLPKSMMYKLFRKKDIKLNGKRCDISQFLSEGDRLTVYVKDDAAETKTINNDFLKSPSELDIIYENENILVVNKPAGLDPHPGSGASDTLIGRIQHYLYNKKEFDPNAETAFSPALCSRLDRNTTGLVTAAKNSASLREINAAIRDGNMHKLYHCIVISPLPKQHDILTAYHHKDDNRNLVKISDSPLEGYREIRTGYRVIATSKRLTLAEITLYTGRTHQIRAHLAHIGSPILGDGKYGDISVNKRFCEFHQNLCACGLSFSLPDDSPLAYLNNITITAPSPAFEKKYFPNL